MALVPHKITALAESDAQGTDGKNIVAGAVVSLYDTNGTVVTLFDDANGTNGSTAKQTDAAGQVVVYVTPGEYDEEVNGSIKRRVSIGGNGLTSYPTTASLESSRPTKTGQRAENRERANAQYTLAAEGYTAQAGDVVAANGRVWELQIDGSLNLGFITSSRGAQAIRDVVSAATSRGISELSLSGYSYTFAENETVNLSGVSDLKIVGEGAKITGPNNGVSANLFYGDSIDNVEIEGVDFYNGTNHVFSLLNPANTTIRECKFYGQTGFAVIMFTDDRGASGVAKNNHIIDCYADGQGVADGGFGMESMRDSSIVNPVVTGVTVATPGYAVNLKNRCINTHVINYNAYKNAHGLVFSDDASNGLGSGCLNCTASGVSYDNDLSGVSMNKTNGCYVDAYIDQNNNNQGFEPTAHAGLAIQGFCTGDSYDVVIKNIHPDQKAINVRSQKQTIRIKDYDLSSTNMLSLDGSADEVRTFLFNYDTASNLFNPSSYIDDNGSANEFTNMRRFRGSSIIFDVEGESLTNYQLGALTDQVITRVNAVNAFAVNTEFNIIGPASGQDNVFSAGRSDRRYSEVFAANGTINTSDERKKTELLEISESEKACALEIKANIRKYKMLDSVERKGEDGARIHFGVGAQTVASIFEKHGLDTGNYSLFCFDEWESTPEVKDEDGIIVQDAVEAGSLYGIRYDQLAMFILSAI